MANRLIFPIRHFNALSKIVARGYHDYVRAPTKVGGMMRIPLNSPRVIGVINSRGNRSHQEDFYGFATLNLNPEELKASLNNALGVSWQPSDPLLAGQVLFLGLYDGHGGSAVAQYLRQELHGLLESVDKAVIPELYTWITHEVGGYFKRFKGGALAPWTQGHCEKIMTLEARATLAFFEVDRTLSMDDTALTCGATASVAILQSLDTPTTPFFSADMLALTVAHCGDTRVILCSTKDGTPFPMTETHHADAHVESIRLRKMMGSSLITDSYGESRWMGALANTRCLGDLHYKKFGVTPEPEVRTKLLQGEDWAFMVMVSDGISSILSDGEIVDLARGAKDPKTAAERILAFSEELGGEDNATAIVVPFRGWGKVTGPDNTKQLREYRSRQAVGSERQRRM